MTFGVHSGKAVILGAAGFMGVNLVRALTAQGTETAVFDRKPSPHWPNGIKTIIGEIASPPAALREAMEGAAVFHLAGATRPAASTIGIGEEIASSIADNVALLEWSRGCACRWVFVSSGGTVYGEARTPLIAENHPTEPVSSYGIAKLAVEKYFHLYRALYGSDYVIARVANPFGPFQLPNIGQGLVATLISRLRRGEAIEIWGDGQNVRDYLFIDDTVEALIRLADRGSPGGVYNVGSETGTSINQLIDLLAQVTGRVPVVSHHPARQIDVRRNILDASLLMQDTGWRPLHTLQAGLKRTSAWFDEHLSDC